VKGLSAFARGNGGIAALPRMTTLPRAARFARRMSVFFAGYFVVTGISIPFLPIWLKARGLTDTEIAFCLALPMGARILLTPLASLLAGRVPTLRTAVRILVALAVTSFSIADLRANHFFILVLTGTAFTFWGLALPIAESMAIAGVRRFGLHYGHMRVSGSISFILSNLASGAALGAISPNSVFWLIEAGIVVAAAAAFVLPLTPAKETPDRSAAIGSARPMLRHRGFLALLCVGGLVQASHAVLYGFASIYWQNHGFSATEIGALWAMGVIGEIVLFSFSGRAIQLLGPFGLLAAGASAAILRWALFPLDLGFAGYLGVQSLHALTFGASYLGIQSAITRMVSDEITASAQGLYVMIANIAMAATTVLSGPLFEMYGKNAFYVMTIPPVLAVIVLICYHRIARPQQA
jgi:PPP family 3-phenylpropionic acid transporter